MSWRAKMALLARRCPSGWRLTRAASEGPDPALARHLGRCEGCSRDYRALLGLANKVDAAFPAPEKMSRDSREAIAEHLRAARPELRSRRALRAPWWVAAPITLVALTAGGWGLKRALVSRDLPRAPTATLQESRATIRAIGPARFARAAMPPDEVVSLDEGSIELEVAPLRAGERFRVKTADGEVEVRGTSFKVSASDHRLTAVHVWRGRVEVRSLGGALAVLETGDDWIRGTATTPATSAALASKATNETFQQTSPRARANRSRSAGGGGAIASKAGAPALEGAPPIGGASFSHAWRLLRQGDAGAAAAEFAEVQRLARGRDIEEDALYWRAAATGQAGDAAGARRLFGDFLERFSGSSRAGQAAVALGWLLLDAGETRAAGRAFEGAARDRSPQVRAQAQEGLRRIPLP
jgi:TolA-binding protein